MMTKFWNYGIIFIYFEDTNQIDNLMRRLIFCICLMALSSILNAGDGFPARWFFDNGFSKNAVAVKMWLDKGVALATDGAGSASAIVGVNPKYTPEEIVALTKRITSEIRRYSPDAEIYLENDWSYSHKKSGDKFLGFGSFEEFDRYGGKGVNLIASADSNVNWIQPAYNI